MANTSVKIAIVTRASGDTGGASGRKIADDGLRCQHAVDQA